MPAEMERKALEARLKLASKEFHEEVMTPLAITPREPPLFHGAPTKPRPDWTPVFKHVGWHYERKEAKDGRDVFIVRAAEPGENVGGANYIYNYLEGLAKGTALKHGLQVHITHLPPKKPAKVLAKKIMPPIFHEFQLRFLAPGEKPVEAKLAAPAKTPPTPPRSPSKLPPASAAPTRATAVPPIPPHKTRR